MDYWKKGGRKNEWMEKRRRSKTEMDGWMDGRTDRQTETDRQIDR
jgi:hypothetical protein